MGLYTYITEEERDSMKKVTDPEMQSLFNEALTFDNSLLITEHKHRVKNGLFKKDTFVTCYSIFHDEHVNKPSYQARFISAGSGSKEMAMAYLYGIMNGWLHSITPSPTEVKKEN